MYVEGQELREVWEWCGVEEKGKEKRKRRQKRNETNRRKIFDIKIEGVREGLSKARVGAQVGH